MRIHPVTSDADLKAFIHFPWRIYTDDHCWVPPLVTDVNYALVQNPYWEHAEKALFLAYDDAGKIAGRIAAIIDHNYIEFQQDKVGFFGFFEAVNDQAIAAGLYDAAAGWLAQKGLARMMGPMNPSTNDECGFLCEGFNTPPRLMMPHTPPYYLDLAEQCGLTKQKDLYAYDMTVSGTLLERLGRISHITTKKLPGLTIKKFNLKDFHSEVARAVAIYNAAWEKNWGFVPLTNKEFYETAKRLKDLLLLDTTLLAEVNGKPAGMLIAVPDYNIVMKRMNGSLYPFGLLKFLYYRRTIDALRLMIMGVVKEYRHRGIEGVLYYEALKNSLRLGYKKCEFSWILDDNIMTQRAAEMMGGTLYKKYRVYGR